MVSPYNLHTNRQSPGRRGFSLMEMMVALAVIALILVLFGATMPLAFRGAGQGRTYTQAALIAQHKIDQLRQAGFNNLNYPTLRSLGIIDAAKNADGSFSFTYTDTLVDHDGKRGYFGTGSDSVPLVTSSIVIGQVLPQLGANAPSTLKAYQVTVTLSWSGSGIHAGSFSTHTIIASP